jgi:hypothetical protein
MALAVNDIVKITDFQLYLGQLMENVFFYHIDAIPTPASGLTVEEELCRSYEVDVRLFMIAFQETSCSHGIVRMDNVTNGIDFAELNDPVAGAIVGDAEPSFLAYNFVLRRTTGITRNGSKRIGGLDEGGSSGNGITTISTLLTAFATAMAAPLLDNTAPTPVAYAHPVIVGRKVVGTGSHGPIYGLDLTKINPIASAAFTAVSTQRSRKAGHGV